jgi:hypothetical protein
MQGAFVCVCVRAGDGTRGLHKLGKCSITELYPHLLISPSWEKWEVGVISGHGLGQWLCCLALSPKGTLGLESLWCWWQQSPRLGWGELHGPQLRMCFAVGPQVGAGIQVQASSLTLCCSYWSLPQALCREAKGSLCLLTRAGQLL